MPGATIRKFRTIAAAGKTYDSVIREFRITATNSKSNRRTGNWACQQARPKAEC